MSKQQSSSSLPLEPIPVFYLDENLASDALAKELRRFSEWGIEQHYDHFQRGKTPDPEVIAKCGEHKWTILSCDDRLRVVAQNIEAVHRHAVRVFMFPEGNYQGAEYKAALIVARRQLIKLVRKTAAPCFGRMFITGKVHILTDKPIKQMTSKEKTMLKYGTKVFNEAS